MGKANGQGIDLVNLMKPHYGSLIDLIENRLAIPVLRFLSHNYKVVLWVERSCRVERDESDYLSRLGKPSLQYQIIITANPTRHAAQ
jgi:hypothetical protein